MSALSFATKFHTNERSDAELELRVACEYARFAREAQRREATPR